MRSWVRILPGAGLFSSSIFPTFLHQWSVPKRGASLTMCCENSKKWMTGCAAWGKIDSTSSDQVKNRLNTSLNKPSMVIKTVITIVSRLVEQNLSDTTQTRRSVTQRDARYGSLRLR